MESRQEKYFKNYEMEQIPKPNGKGYKKVYKYIGDYYTWELPPKKLRLERILFVVLEIITAVIYFFTATREVDLNSHIYVMAPALISLCAWIFELFAIWYFSFGKLPLREEDYKRIESTFYITFPLRVFCLLITVAAGVFVTVRNSLGLPGWLVCAGYAVCMVIALVMYFRYKNVKAHMKVILAQ